MKNYTLIAFVCFIIIGFVSCNKDDAPGSIVGNWSIVSDSTYSGGIGPNGTPSSNLYKGVPGDYYNFTANGKLYVNEGNFLIDTANYTVTGQKINLVYTYLYEGGATITGAIGSFEISSLTENALTLSNGGITPGAGYVGEVINLKRN